MLYAQYFINITLREHISLIVRTMHNCIHNILKASLQLYLITSYMLLTFTYSATYNKSHCFSLKAFQGFG